MARKKIVISKRARVLFTLDKLSSELQRDVLKDLETVKRWDIPTRRTMRLSEDLTVQWESLLSVFRAAVDGLPAPSLLDEGNNELSVTASIDSQGAGFLEVGRHRFRFSHAVLMSGSPKRRLRELERIFDSVTIHSGLQDELRRIVGGHDFGLDEFVAVAEALASSPEEFQARLSEETSTRQPTLGEILPADGRHWDNLTVPPTKSDALADFIREELASEWTARVDRNPTSAFRSIALTFSAPTLVPHNLFEALDNETKKRILEEALLLDDHFSLIGAFELCADWVADDPEFSELGERLLVRLFGDLEWLEIACGMFGAALVLTVAKIAKDEKVNARPAFWRRLAAASHALLLVRTFGVSKIDHKSLIQWSLQEAGQSYFLSVFCDFRTDPQWRPEWIDPRILLADVCGRAIGVFARIPKEQIPPAWAERIDKLRAWVSEEHYQLLTVLPAIMEGARRPHLPIVSEMQDIGELYEELMQEPTVDHLLSMRLAIPAFGPPREIVESLHKLVGIIRSDSSADPEGRLADALTLLGHVAALLQDTTLANAVAEACIERLVIEERRETAIEAIYRFLECSAAEAERVAANSFLSRKLEQLCYTIKNPELLAEVATWIGELKLVSPELRFTVGRALAIAKLGALSAAAG
ncbi:hypothetical protein [Inquilinus limosus]|uniref:hypothetical protein n=1 Tax=Inquilinus limosus TaxID=171674 RepID=UPI0003FD3917|nr:hypothetical protein [Inquilinus limosus]